MQRTTLPSATIDSAINRSELRKKTQEHRNLQLHQEPTLLPQETKQTEEVRSSPNKSRVRSRKLHLTEQKSKRKVENAKSPNKSSNEQRTMVAPAHNHAENYENLQELTLWMGTGFTRPHGGCPMILPVDQNVEACLVKLGSTCAPRQAPSFATIHLKDLQKNRAAPLRPIALQRPSQ